MRRQRNRRKITKIEKCILWIRGLWEKIPPDRIYLTILLVFGVVCLTVTGGWKYYLDPFREGMEMFVRDLPDQEEGPDERQGEYQTGTGESQRKETPARPSEESAKQDPGQDPEQDPEETRSFSFDTVEDDYFADAVFIGDSRTVGMYEYGGLQDISAFYASTGLTVRKLFTAKIVEVPGERQKITVEEALSARQFAKIYYMIGINEMGTGTAESFLQDYAESVERIRQMQPDAIIYLQGIMQVTAERSAQGDYITNEGIAVRNEGIAELADNETIFYLDVNEAVCGEDGAMIADYTYDGVHLKAQYIPLWKDYLKSHAVVYDQ